MHREVNGFSSKLYREKLREIEKQIVALRPAAEALGYIVSQRRMQTAVHDHLVDLPILDKRLEP